MSPGIEAEAQDRPKVNYHGAADGEERKEADHLARDGGTEARAGEAEPDPPRPGEFAGAHLDQIVAQVNSKEGVSTHYGRVFEKWM